MRQNYRINKKVTSDKLSVNLSFEINLLVLRVISKQAKITPKIRRHSSMILILFVFIRNRLIAKPNEFKSDLFIGQNSVPYRSTGRHLRATN